MISIISKLELRKIHIIKVIAMFILILRSIAFQSIGIQTINMDSHVLSEGDSRKHIILGLIWQILAVCKVYIYIVNWTNPSNEFTC